MSPCLEDIRIRCGRICRIYALRNANTAATHLGDVSIHDKISHIPHTLLPLVVLVVVVVVCAVAAVAATVAVIDARPPAATPGAL